MKKTGRNIDTKFYVQSIARAFAIIEVISEANDHGLSLSEIAEKIDLPISTVYRIVQNLIAWRHLAEKDNGNYTLGFAYLTYGNIVKRDLVLTNYARKYMEELNQKTRETIYLAILDRTAGDIIYIDKLESHRNIKLAAGVGTHNYIHSTANGKCLVSRLGSDKLRELIGVRGMPALTPATITDLAKFGEEIKRVRETGFALDDLENEPGVRCVAAPILDYTGNVVAAVSISGVEANMSLDTLVAEYSALVREAALNISRQMGYDISGQ
ncbi:IclR family transcriptional regulator [Anaeroselena agilis]|uniref:IclR family transcriptional regulator n=1 Tax=Anaeroselena agilis TaxID=3063788 RepID=A0ABU3P331_9FIRM|nr:IclR family transcriptional regulator [Selenomonadales bacterium 4137-cl]